MFWRSPTATPPLPEIKDEIEEVALAMFDAWNKHDGNVVIGWEDQPPVYKELVRKLARAAIDKTRELSKSN